MGFLGSLDEEMVAVAGPALVFRVENQLLPNHQMLRGAAVPLPFYGSMSSYGIRMLLSSSDIIFPAFLSST